MVNFLSPAYYFYKKRLFNEIQQRPMPTHIGIILDGNRRYASFKGIPLEIAYEHGARKLEEVLNWIWNLNIDVVSVWVFSTENFSRDPSQVDLLMNLARDKLLRLRDSKDVHERKVRIQILGARELLPPHVQEAIESVENATKDYDQKYLNILMAYGGRREITDAVKAIAEKIQKGEITSEDITEEYLTKHMYTKGLPDPDLIIRTSGVERLSGFMMWQSAYSEFYFAEVFWPMFREIDLWRAIRTFQQRKRNFGK